MDIDGLPLSPSLDPTPALLLMNNIRMEPNVSEAGAEMLLCQPALDSDFPDDSTTPLASPEPVGEIKQFPIPVSTLTSGPTTTPTTTTTAASIDAVGQHWPDVPADRQFKIPADSGLDLTADVEGDVTMPDAIMVGHA